MKDGDDLLKDLEEIFRCSWARRDVFACLVGVY